MIAAIRGVVWRIDVGALIVDVQGVGYRVAVIESVLRSIAVGAEIELMTHHVIREDVQELYGFTDAGDLELFSLLISVSGIGPRTALAVLSGTSSTSLRLAIMREDLVLLRQTAGIGPKTAQRLVVELKDKVGVLGIDLAGLPAIVPVGVDEELVTALTGLGYSLPQAKEVAMTVHAEGHATMQGKIKAALRHLAPVGR